MCCPVLPFWGFSPFGFMSTNYMIPQNTYLPWDSYKTQLFSTLGCQGMTDPQLAYQQGYQYGAQLGQSIIEQTTLQAKVSSLTSDINSLKSSIATALASDKVTQEQKEQLKLLQEQLDEILGKIQKLQGQNALAELDTLQAEFNEIKGMVTQIANQIKADLGDITENIGGNTGKTGNVGKTGNTETSNSGLNPNISDFENKNSAYTGEIIYFIPTVTGGKATCRAAFTDKRGVKHTYTADDSGKMFIVIGSGINKCRRYMADKIREQILADGFTNVTLSNPNGYAC